MSGLAIFEVSSVNGVSIMVFPLLMDVNCFFLRTDTSSSPPPQKKKFSVQVFMVEVIEVMVFLVSMLCSMIVLF